ncbi:MAG: N-acetyltransferase [Bacteroidetes bacterium]|nr:N-acetyltransferase [Bacteroidota bacterium]
MNQKIRIATIDDLPAIVDIYNQSIPHRLATADIEPISVEQRLDWFHKHVLPQRPLWLMELDDQVAGWCSFQDFYGRCAYQSTVEISIYVDYQFQQLGVAKKLLSNAIDYAKLNDIESIVAFVFSHNKPSINLFLRHEFASWGLLPNVAELDGVKISLSILGKSI